MLTSNFDFSIPAELIAQQPAKERDQSRLMIFHRPTGELEHLRFSDLPYYLNPGDVLVLNNSRVIQARLRGINSNTGGQFEILLLEENQINDWWAMVRPGKRARAKTHITLKDNEGNSTSIIAAVLENNSEGHRRLQFAGTTNIMDHLEQFGEMPVPPYIKRSEKTPLAQDRERYQTVFANCPGSVAAPTAALHFTNRLLDKLRFRGVRVCFVTLHVGLGTFAPVKTESVEAHRMHDERFTISEETAKTINSAKQSGHRVIAVGTTVLRVLETVARGLPYANPSQCGSTQNQSIAESIDSGVSRSALSACNGKTGIFIYPPSDFKIVDVLLTNFHLPRSTLLMLVSAFAAPGELHGLELILSAYAEAIRRNYRFFSYGDAMLIA